ncbi:MAG: class I SAM-dependent methyltransferase [Anaerolineae bacterium]|nr:class I SAM-dependent methyltransferase [Anaerolineae bacterium]
MTSDIEVKQQVKDFYDQVGWQELGNGMYQNARYEDLRPVTSEYIHNCHLRVSRHLRSSGKLMLDAGSGPIQYPEYLTYSEGYDFRVCADISMQALREARKRIGEHGLFVVSDVANLPFKPHVFDGVVSLHTIHHLPMDEHVHAYQELERVLGTSRQAVVVNGWADPLLARFLLKPMRWTNRLQGVGRRILGRPSPQGKAQPTAQKKKNEVKSTYVQKSNAAWLKKAVGEYISLEIFVWRSVSVKHTRTFIHAGWGGGFWLRVLYFFEERFPHFFGENGQYPLVVIAKH